MLVNADTMHITYSMQGQGYLQMETWIYSHHQMRIRHWSLCLWFLEAPCHFYIPCGIFWPWHGPFDNWHMTKFTNLVKLIVCWPLHEEIPGNSSHTHTTIHYYCVWNQRNVVDLKVVINTFNAVNTKSTPNCHHLHLVDFDHTTGDSDDGRAAFPVWLP